MKFIINTITEWNEPPRCRHQVALELCKKNKVVFIEKNKIGRPKINTIKEHKNFTRIVPYWPIDGRIRTRIPLINELYQNYLFKRLKKNGDVNLLGDDRIINFDFTAHRLFQFFHGSRITYYCNDDFIGHGRFKNIITTLYHRNIENLMIKKSAICIATSNYLYEKMTKINKNTHLILLGAPSGIPNQFLKYRNNKQSCKIKVIYVGYMIKSKLSVDWIKTSAEDKQLEIYLVGPADDNVKKALRHCLNVHFLGVKTGHDLYSVLSGANVCICPYDTGKINNGTTPNKLWLYLAMGKPVVITEIENMKTWNFDENIIYRVNDVHGFKVGIKKAVQNDTELLFRKRIQLAEQNNWRSKMRHYMDIVKNQNF